MATYSKRGPYQWQTKIRRKGYPVQTKTFNTRAEAEAWASTVESEMTRGMFVSRKEAESTTLTEALDWYEQEISSRKKSHAIEKVYIRTLKKSFLSSRFLAGINGSDVSKYRDARLKDVSPTAVRHELSLLSHLFTIAIKEWSMFGLINPVTQIRKPTPNKPRDRRLLPGEEKALIEACESYGGDLPHIVRLALETGMRRSEIAGMIWDLVDLKKRTVTLPETKNGEKRIVPLPIEAVRILSGLPRRIDGKVWGITSHAVAVAWRRAVSRARDVYEKEYEKKGERPESAFLTDLTFHDLRHEATSRFFELGLDATKVKEITGHKTYSMLARYTHLKAEDIALEIDSLEKERDRKAVENQVEKMK